MARNKDNRARILKAAEHLFAEHGFDATSVDRIAQTAEVNKALVYYYFKNKQDLLTSLFAEMRADMRDRAQEAPAGQTPSLRGKVADEITYLQQRRRTLAVLLMEAFKQDTASQALFETARGVIDEELSRRGFAPPAHGEPLPPDRQRALVHEFFTGVLPVLGFVTLRDAFCSHFNFAPDDIDALFLDAFEASHLASHIAPRSIEAS